MPALVFLLLAVSQGFLAQLRAPQVQQPQGSRSRIVVVRPTSPDLDSAAYMSAIADHGSSVNLEVAAVEPSVRGPFATALEVATIGETLGVFWIDVQPEELAIYLYSSRARGVYVREVPRAGGESDASLVESVGLIIASTSIALGEGKELGMRVLDAKEVEELASAAEPEPEPEAATPEPEPQPDATPQEPTPKEPPPDLGSWRLFVAYLGEGFDSAAPWQSGVRVGGSFDIHPRVRLGIGYGYLAPAELQRSTSAFELQRHELTLSAGVGGDLGERITLHGEVFGATQFARWKAGSRDGTRILARMGPTLELGVELGRGVYFDLGVGAAITLNRFSFVVCETPESSCSGQERRVVASPWRIAPRGTIGLSYRAARKRR